MDYLYKTPKGWPVRELSHSAYSKYMESPAKFKYCYLYGLRERRVWATAEHGKDIQQAIISFYRGQDPVETFSALWRAREAETLHYPRGDSWKSLLSSGIGLMEALTRKAAQFPIRKPVWLDWKDKTLPRLHDSASGLNYVSIPDLIEPGTLVADVKCLDRPLPDDNPNLVILDNQLRTQAAATQLYRVALWVFARTPHKVKPTVAEIRTMASGCDDTLIIEGVRHALDLTIDEAAELMEIGNAKAKAQEFKKQAKRDPELVLKAENLKATISTRCRNEYRIQWIEGEMTQDHAMEAVRDEMSVIPLIQQQFFPCRCGIRWPNDQALRCPYAGLCLAERTPNAPPEWRAKWQAMTDENLKRWDESALEGLD